MCRACKNRAVKCSLVVFYRVLRGVKQASGQAHLLQLHSLQYKIDTASVVTISCVPV